MVSWLGEGGRGEEVGLRSQLCSKLSKIRMIKKAHVAMLDDIVIVVDVVVVDNFFIVNLIVVVIVVVVVIIIIVEC